MVTAILLAASFGSALVRAAGTPLPPSGNRAPAQIVFSPDGDLAYVSEAEEGTVAVLDARQFTVLGRVETGGRKPAGLAVSADGATLLAANTFSGSLGVIDTRSRKLLRTIPLPGMPWAIALHPDGKRAFVSVSQLDEVAVVDLASGPVKGRIAIGRRPRALRLTPDGATLAVANLAGGSISVIDTASLKEVARVRLKGVNVRGLAVTADGAEAYATLMPAFNLKPTSDPAEMWHNIVQAVKLEGKESGVAEDQWLDFARLPGSVEVFGTPDQYDLALDTAAKHAWIAVGGRDVLTRITVHDRRRDAIWPISQIEAPVGANPRGLALTPDEKQVWVANYLGNSITVVDAASMRPLRTIDLGPATRVDPTLPGQYLFHNAGMTRTLRFTCASCHPDGGSDGLVWSFVHVPDRFPRRNSRDLRNGVPGSAPFRWSGYEKSLHTFVEDEVTGLLGGPKPTAEQTEALVKAVWALEMPPNPFRTAAGELTPEAHKGKALFEGKAGCISCHAGPNLGGTGLSAWVGTTEPQRPTPNAQSPMPNAQRLTPGLSVDVPQLRGVYDGAPYLHDGRAATLEQVFDRFNDRKLHGKAHTLTAAEMTALLRYLREL